MEVTRYNAHLVYEDFRQQIRKCEFMAVDQEMTGVNIPGADRVSGLSPEETYQRLRDAVLKYNAFQYGICLFTKAASGGYEVRPYNFYLLKKEGFLVFDNTVFPFHVQHKLDFTKWFSSGMPYCTKEQEEAATKGAFPVPIDSAEQAALDGVRTSVEEWHAGGEPSLDVEIPCSLHLANVIRSYFEHVNKHLFVSLAISGSPYFAEPVKFHFERITAEAFHKKQESKREEEQCQVLKKVGFRLFWKEIVESKKPMVGHNFLQDLMFMLNMHETRLPEDYATFKRETYTLLPEIYDTKTIAASLTSKFPVTHLGVVYNACKTLFGMNATQFSKYFHLPPGFYEYDEEYIKVSPKAHEGAYDAYMTGVVFIYFQKNHNDTLAQCKNLISIFAATHFFKNGDEADQYYTDTYIISTKNYLFVDQVEGMLFDMENRRADFETNGKVDFKKLNYIVSAVKANELNQSNLFCVIYKNAGDEQTVKNKIEAYKQRSSGPCRLSIQAEEVKFTAITAYYSL